jgi:pimeloyl-ACP methyl ester carboxylesterase
MRVLPAINPDWGSNMTAASAAMAGHSPSRPRLKAPHRGLLLIEGRAILELAGTALATPILNMAPKGDGHPVMLLPGFLASDRSTKPIRKYLERLGYDARPWALGQNLGGFYKRRRILEDRLMQVHQETGKKVSLVGWSLGGVYARYLSLVKTDAVRSVITLGSPFAGDVHATNASKLYEFLSGEKHAHTKHEDLEALAGHLPVPNSSIYTKLDSIVNWRTCIAPAADNAENIEVHLASHVGIGVNAAAWWAVADRLAQPEGSFKPFARSGPFALAYGR